MKPSKEEKSKVTRDLVVLFEHPKWQQPLFETLDRKGVPFTSFDLKSAAINGSRCPEGVLYFNQASPSAYVRGNTRAVPFALAFIEDLELRGRRVLNGSRPFRIELSKWRQLGLMRQLEIDHPATWLFNNVQALRRVASELTFPAVLKPDQGGSGARMFRIDSLEELEHLLHERPELWLPDHLMLLQEYLDHDSEKQGIVRLEFLGGELLYAMRVVSRGSFNLCPSEFCNPADNQAAEACTQTDPGNQKQAPEFYPFPEVPESAVETARRLFTAAGLDIGAVEYLETREGRRVFYDVNANSNLRRPVGESYGFDPFEKVADFLAKQLEGALLAA